MGRVGDIAGSSASGRGARDGGDFEIERLRHVRALRERLPGEVDKLGWPLERLHALRDERLRALVRRARADSPWHAARLRGVDPETVAGSDLSALPTMTKADLMANWDEIVTDRRLTLELANAHLSRIAEDGLSYLLGEYMVIESGGTSGVRGVFVWDFEGWLSFYLAIARIPTWWECHLPHPAGERRAADIMAQAVIHATTATALTFAAPGAALAGSAGRFPVTLPLTEIVEGLDAYQPTAINGYPSALHRLALEAQAGRLHIAPWSLGCGAEPLLPEARRAIDEAFGIGVTNVYGTSEGGYLAASFRSQPGLHLNEDLAVYEPVDAQNRPVRPGERAAKLLLTNVVNQVMPLIRYELTDEVTFLDEPNPGPWTGRRIGDIQGRFDDWFTYPDGVAVHPYVFASVLGGIEGICEYQVRQTRTGADIMVRLDDEAALDRVRDELGQALRRVGLEAPQITLSAVEVIPRLPGTGKLRRFVPLPGAIPSAFTLGLRP